MMSGSDTTVASVPFGVSVLEGNTMETFTCHLSTVHCRDSGIGQDHDFSKSSQRDADVQPNREISTNTQSQHQPGATSASSPMTSGICSSILARAQRAGFNLSEYPRIFSTPQMKRSPRGSRRRPNVGRGGPRAIR
jgi:hypothetical protein